MSAVRMSARSLKALTVSKPAARSLHMTGPATFSSLLTSDKPSMSGSNTSRLPVSATIPVPDTTDTGKPVRHFNTSRSMKAVNDTSTIDFMYIPDFDPDTKTAPVPMMVPILPFVGASENIKSTVTEAETPVMMPTIHTVAADGTHIHAPSAMFDMTDSDHIDFQGMANKVASRFASPVEDGQSMLKQVWGGLVDDVLGPKHAKA